MVATMPVISQLPYQNWKPSYFQLINQLRAV